MEWGGGGMSGESDLQRNYKFVPVLQIIFGFSGVNIS